MATHAKIFILYSLIITTLVSMCFISSTITATAPIDTRITPVSPLGIIKNATTSPDKLTCGYKTKPKTIKLGSQNTEFEITEFGVICHQYNVITNVDAATFQPLSSWLAKDKTRIYARNLVLDSLDTETIIGIDNNWFKDKNRVWRADWDIKSQSFHAAEYPEINAKTFRILSDGYATDGKFVYFESSNIDADAKSFKPLPSPTPHSLAYAEDKNHVYFGAKVLEDADRASFVNLGGNYARDARLLYYRGEIMKNINPSRVRIGESYMTDGKNIYKGSSTTLAQLDAATFRDIAFGYVSDINGVWFFDEYGTRELRKVDRADPQSFMPIGTCSSIEKSSARYFKDKNSVYTEYEQSPEIDAQSFKFFGSFDANPGGMPASSSYSKDKNHVYIGCGSILKDADPASFKIIKDGYAMDNDHIWESGKVLMGGDRARCSAGSTELCGMRK